jgi:serine/threonine-protein kinase
VATWKLASRLSHPNLVRILDAGLWHADGEHDMHFAVMEYCEESLAEVLSERPLTSDEARQMLLPTLEALKYLHSQGITHGQINPKTIRAAGDQVKLSCDAVHRDAEASPTSAASPYDPPERSTGAMSLSADVWSLGMTLYESLTAHLPASGPTAVPDRSTKLPPPFDAIVEGCLRPDRERRLSVSAIRQLLDKPVKTPVPDALPAIAVQKAASQPEPAAPTTQLSAKAPSVRPSPDHRIAKAAPFSDGKRIALVAAVAIVVILALVTLSHRGSQPSPSATVRPVQSPPANAATIARTPAADTPVSTGTPGSVVHKVMPEIAAKARNTIDGTVKVNVKVEVNPEGKVTHASLASRGPSRYFSSHALEAARQWTFVAPVQNGRAQASQWTLRFEFRKSATRATAQRNSVS